MSWTVRVRAAGRRRAVAYVRDHRFEVGAPVEFDREAPAVSALEYALAALAADLVGTFAEQARRSRVPVGAAEAVVTGSLNNPLTVLRVVGEEGHPGLERVTVKLYVASPAAADDARRVWDDARRLSPLARTLGVALDLDLELAITP